MTEDAKVQELRIRDARKSLREWARAQAREAPPWSDAQWRSINAALGYKLKEESD